MILDSGSQTMGKQGRSVQLPPDVYVFSEAYEAGTGVKFNRQILAAFLKFIFEEFRDFNNAEWTAFATVVERGEMHIEDLPLFLARQLVEVYDAERKKRKRGVSSLSCRKLSDDEIRARLDDAQTLLQEWESRTEDYTDSRRTLLAKLKGTMAFKMGEESESKEK
jgi:hypothetical protein